MACPRLIFFFCLAHLRKGLSPTLVHPSRLWRRPRLSTTSPLSSLRTHAAGDPENTAICLGPEGRRQRGSWEGGSVTAAGERGTGNTGERGGSRTRHGKQGIIVGGGTVSCKSPTEAVHLPCHGLGGNSQPTTPITLCSFFLFCFHICLRTCAKGGGIMC